MLNENAKKWVAALRSGEYKQAQNKLAKPDGFCCLGVACELAIQEGLVDKKGALGVKGDILYFRYDGQGNYLPEVVKKWLGLNEATATYLVAKGETRSLADMNDRGEPFSVIADTIESEPEGLFAE